MREDYIKNWVDRSIQRKEKYWSRVGTCAHGDWCLDCHWPVQDFKPNGWSRPTSRMRDGRVQIHRHIYLQYFPDGLPGDTLLVSDCGNTACVNPAHQKRDIPAWRCRLLKYNQDNPTKKKRTFTKVTPDVVRSIRATKKKYPDYTSKRIALMHGVSESAARNIIVRKTYPDIPDEAPDETDLVFSGEVDTEGDFG